MDTKIRNIENAIMKSVMDVFRDDALKFFGVKAKIVSSARTELKNLQIITAFMDYTFFIR